MKISTYRRKPYFRKDGSKLHVAITFNYPFYKTQSKTSVASNIQTVFPESVRKELEYIFAFGAQIPKNQFKSLFHVTRPCTCRILIIVRHAENLFDSYFSHYLQSVPAKTI